MLAGVKKNKKCPTGHLWLAEPQFPFLLISHLQEQVRIRHDRLQWEPRVHVGMGANGLPFNYLNTHHLRDTSDTELGRDARWPPLGGVSTV
jgi:hypothetical protein